MYETYSEEMRNKEFENKVALSITKWLNNFPANHHARLLLVGWLVGRLVCHNFIERHGSYTSILLLELLFLNLQLERVACQPARDLNDDDVSVAFKFDRSEEEADNGAGQQLTQVQIWVDIGCGRTEHGGNGTSSPPPVGLFDRDFFSIFNLVLAPFLRASVSRYASISQNMHNKQLARGTTGLWRRKIWFVVGWPDPHWAGRDSRDQGHRRHLSRGQFNFNCKIFNCIFFSILFNGHMISDAKLPAQRWLLWPRRIESTKCALFHLISYSWNCQLIQDLRLHDNPK